MSSYSYTAQSDSTKQWLTPYEKSNGKETATYHEAIAYYQSMAKAFPQIQITEFGKTDSGEPLHRVLYSHDEDFDIANLRKKDRAVLLINNGIHPGEPDGIDASMMLLRNIALQEQLQEELKNITLAIIPVYNIGGALNRNSNTRANQQGPAAYGFRGNARNYDLNRDFIKTDTGNMRAFAQIFHSLDPDVLLDTHVSNGADYQYVLTLIMTQKDKLGGKLGSYMDKQFEPALFEKMNALKIPMTPYVNVWGTTPDHGWEQFMDWARYSSGYAALFNTISMMTETHMLKTHQQRTEATYAFMAGLIQTIAAQRDTLLKTRQQAKQETRKTTRYALDWQLDKSRADKFDFLGYEARRIPSKVTTGERLFYDRKKPYTKTIPFYKHYQAALPVNAPKAYLIPKAWQHIADLLTLNGVRVETIHKTQVVTAEVYAIEDYDTAKEPFEGHYLHSNIKLSSRTETIQTKAGDFRVELNQEQNRYIVETLEPQAKDSFFAWNFFDTILQQKEHYSAYVFEDLADTLLNEDATLKSKFTEKLKSDVDFRNDPDAQLEFIYQYSPYAETTYRRYPIYRLPQE